MEDWISADEPAAGAGHRVRAAAAPGPPGASCWRPPAGLPRRSTAADAYLAIARAVGDDKSAAFLIQAKMYAHLDMGRVPEAVALGEELLASHRAAGRVIEEAKTLCDLAQLHVSDPVRRRHAQPGPGRRAARRRPAGHRPAPVGDLLVRRGRDRRRDVRDGGHRVRTALRPRFAGPDHLVRPGLRQHPAALGPAPGARRPRRRVGDAVCGAAPRSPAAGSTTTPAIPARRPRCTGPGQAGRGDRGGEARARGDHAAAAGRELPVRPDGTPGPGHQPPRAGRPDRDRAASSWPPATCPGSAAGRTSARSSGTRWA